MIRLLSPEFESQSVGWYDRTARAGPERNPQSAKIQESLFQFRKGVNILIHSPLNTRFPQQQGHDVDLVVFSIDSVP